MLSLAGLGERTVPSYSHILAKVEAYVVDIYQFLKERSRCGDHIPVFEW